MPGIVRYLGSVAIEASEGARQWVARIVFYSSALGTLLTVLNPLWAPWLGLTAFPISWAVLPGLLFGGFLIHAGYKRNARLEAELAGLHAFYPRLKLRVRSCEDQHYGIEVRNDGAPANLTAVLSVHHADGTPVIEEPLQPTWHATGARQKLIATDDADYVMVGRHVRGEDAQYPDYVSMQITHDPTDGKLQREGNWYETYISSPWLIRVTVSADKPHPGLPHVQWFVMDHRPLRDPSPKDLKQIPFLNAKALKQTQAG